MDTVETDAGGTNVEYGFNKCKVGTKFFCVTYQQPIKKQVAAMRM
jgi:hypothetical protein